MEIYPEEPSSHQATAKENLCHNEGQAAGQGLVASVRCCSGGLDQYHGSARHVSRRRGLVPRGGCCTITCTVLPPPNSLAPLPRLPIRFRVSWLRLLQPFLSTHPLILLCPILPPTATHHVFTCSSLPPSFYQHNRSLCVRLSLPAHILSEATLGDCVIDLIHIVLGAPLHTVRL